MTVQEFIDGYKVALKKVDSFKDAKNETDYVDQYISKHIKTEYVSYFLKMAEVHKVIEFSMYKEVNGRKVFWKDSPSLFQLFICRLLNHYTDIDLGEDSANGFDNLNREGLIDIIVSYIPEKEYKEWSTLVNMISEDELENTRSFAGYIDTKLEALSLMISALAEDEQIKGAIGEYADKIVAFKNQEG